MRLKDYQTEVLDRLRGFLHALEAKRQEAKEFVAFQQSKGREARLGDYCRETWDALNAEGRLPRARDRQGHEVALPYVPRHDGLGRPVPNVCLKVPTGGGKTLLACAALERIQIEYFKQQTGLVLWIVPSEAIYEQTWKRFANREDPYRQMLERASGGRVKLLEKEDAFSRQDVEQHLCVMLLMLQAGAVKRDSKERRRMFQDSGRYAGFFPEVDDLPANKDLLRRVPNLDVAGTDDPEFRGGWLTVKQSLGNVFKLTRPVVVIDEGHKAYSATALDFIAGHNPRFILELSATPNVAEHVSNVLVNVTGTALQREQMIKLPINLINLGRGDWKHTLTEAVAKLDELKEAARKVERNEGRYIRPILLVRVERTGTEQLDKTEIHAEHVRQFLIEKLGVHPDQVKVKSAEKDELAGVDLLSELCPVRFILTRDALREGWDCPFAYVLAVLSKTTARTALTQMVGRVMRQPHARQTGIPALNECYVFTCDQEVQAAVESVRRGLEEEGMGDLAWGVRVGTAGAAVGARRETIRRRDAFRGLKIFLPYVLAKHPVTGEWRRFDYERDLLSRLDWDRFSFTQRFEPDAQNAYQRTVARISVEDLARAEDSLPGTLMTEEEAPGELDFPALVRLLGDVIPNPWQAARILEETLADLRRRGVTERRLIANRLFLVKAMRDDLQRQVNAAGEREFRALLERGELSFRLVAAGDERLNWELAETLELDLTEEDREFVQRDGRPLERSLFEKVYQKQLNGLEREVAWYLDGERAVRWWHRIAAQQDWHLQGWQRNKVYPDFLACVQELGEGRIRFAVLETKGLHLKGSEDTAYKERLFELLEKVFETGLPAGELQLAVGPRELRFELLLENNWRERIRRPLARFDG